MRLLYDARVTEAGGGVTRFRLAVAYRPPDRLRLEALGPAGGTRLVIATDGREATALLPGDRRYDRAAATPEGLERWTGLPLGAADLGALLQGKPPCGTSIAGRAGGPAVAIRCVVDGADPWSREIHAEGRRRIDLARMGDPAPARLDDLLFLPEVPAGFERATLGEGTSSGAPLLGGGGESP